MGGINILLILMDSIHQITCPIKPIPVSTEPFSHVIINCVGPLPKTKDGNQYLFTIMWSFTCFSEAIRLRNIKAPKIVKALIKFFALVGLPKSVQSDQGLNFMSDLFQDVMAQLRIKQVKSSTYHHQSQRALKRFHHNLKCIMRFLGMAGYYCKFCHNFSTLTEPLTNLLQKGIKYTWSADCQESFEKIKSILLSTAILMAPDFQKLFKLFVDASDVGCGAVLLQEDTQGVDHPVLLLFPEFNCHQRNYCTGEKETLALLLSLQHFDLYSGSTVVPVNFLLITIP